MRNLGLGLAPPVVAISRDGFVLVTLQQWRAILADADLLGQWQQIRATVQELVPLAVASGKSSGRRLPHLARTLHRAAGALAETAGEVSWFSPPRVAKSEQQAADELICASQCVVQAVLACLDQGWAESEWSTVSLHATTADAASRRVETALAARVDEGEDVYDRTLGLSAVELRRGSGVSGAARLAAAWAQNPAGLDKRLRDQTRHLIDDSLTVTPKLRTHLTALAVSDRPLLAHRAALRARNLVTEKLLEDRDRTRSVIARHVRREPWMLSSFRGQVSAWRAYRKATHEDDQVRPLAEFYKSVMEGDVKWTSAVVLDLLGRAVPSAVTLTTAKELLVSESAELLCQMLASVIEPHWRNAVAHEDFRWDSSSGRALLGDQLVDLEDLLDAAVKGRTMCQGFEHGVAVAFAHNAQLSPWDTTEVNEAVRLLDVLHVIGEVGQLVLDIHRRGTSMHLDVPNLSIETLRTLCRAILRASLADTTIDRWEVRQEADRPVLCVDQRGMQEALQLAEPLWASADPLPFAELPLVANAAINSAASAETVTSMVLALAAAHVVGERKRLAGQLSHGDRAAKDELLDTVALICSGVEAAARTLTDDTAKRKLMTFALVLSGDSRRYSDASPPALVSGLTPADRALLRYAPAHIPWIKPEITAAT